ncbi:CDP-alcohol phosphatidyltransferase family protein [Sporosarcina oncorhynchi]|uniref:CDP-alcohol phosphatidyltransferase family protein n=1 Tax=Sporosarcina oncorhynchi TaxID=3056444 RepID=A0ABZ0L2A9_9BACL|nr:CDP-alcohol phosphatidyltransferase family protein [Sporosarcina sp. T2O-4]WOV86751.1 CDP-alcohol phosphatidyltransferase family protein [Sporosarcina sp. T2O-4]
MVSIYDIKPQFQNLLRPIVRRLAKTGVTPNQVTVAAIVLSLITGGLLYLFHENSFVLLLIPIVMFVRMVLNAIDGMLAKEHDMKTTLGNLLNEIGDVVSDAFLYLPFAFISDFSPPLIVGIVLFAIISEMTGVLGEVIGASRRYDGPMGKSDRAFAFGLLALLQAFQLLPASWITGFLSAILLLIIMNIFIRIKQSLKELK